jgi:hypothetical protein
MPLDYRQNGRIDGAIRSSMPDLDGLTTNNHVLPLQDHELFSLEEALGQGTGDGPFLTVTKGC